MSGEGRHCVPRLARLKGARSIKNPNPTFRRGESKIRGRSDEWKARAVRVRKRTKRRINVAAQARGTFLKAVNTRGTTVKSEVRMKKGSESTERTKSISWRKKEDKKTRK